MLNPGIEIPKEELAVLSGLELPYAGINVGASAVEEHVRSAMQRPVPQLRIFQPNRDLVALVGGGPSLNDTFEELRALYFAGAKLITVNGAYNWCLERNLRPSAHFVIDAQAHNTRFIEPHVPNCQYFIASQCHPQLWDVAETYPNVHMLHCGCADEPIRSMLDANFGGQWFNVTGGTTVVTRALYALRMLGFLRFHLFGVDCCHLGGAHHAYAQPENDREHVFTIALSNGESRREFRCSPWMVKQFEDILKISKIDGSLFQIQAHGDGMLAWAIRHAADAASVADTTDAPVMALQGA